MASAHDIDGWLATDEGRRAREAPEEAQGELIDGSFRTMMARTARFHRKHDFDDPISNGHDMGYRLALTMEELGEFAAAITKGKPATDVEEELADVLILLLGHALALRIDLERAFHDKMDRIMRRQARRGGLGIRVTEYGSDDS